MEKNKTKEVFEWIVCILIALVVVGLIKAFVCFPTVVSGDSMCSTLQDKERLWVSKISIEKNKCPERGDIITFIAPTSHTAITAAMADTNNPVAVYDDQNSGFIKKVLEALSITSETSYIKRVIGLPGDHVQIKDGKVYLNGVELVENYLDYGTETLMKDGVFSDVIVPEGYVYVLGDNRGVSFDSRFFGCIPINKIQGKAVFRFWPLNKIGSVEEK